MILPRRKVIQLAAGAAALSAVPHVASAQSYPSRPVRLIVGFPPGGPSYLQARVIGEWLSERLGQDFVIEDRAGASANLAAEAVVKALPDGYTLLLVSSTNAINATLYNKLSFNFVRDIAPIAGISLNPYVMEVSLSIPATSVPEFIAYAKTNPGKMNMASAGTGSATHVFGELFMRMTGVELVHVPYRGSFAYLPDLLDGRVQVVFTPVVTSLDYIRTGKLRALAVTSEKRSQALPDIPSMSDFVPGYDATGWEGVGAPRGTPAEVVMILNKEINAALADPKIRARMADLGATTMIGSPADFAKFIADETEKWSEVVKFSGAKPD